MLRTAAARAGLRVLRETLDYGATVQGEARFATIEFVVTEGGV
jgi:hypothetical protein